MDPRHQVRLYPHAPVPDGTSWGWWRTPSGQIVELETRGVIAEPVTVEDEE